MRGKLTCPVSSTGVYPFQCCRLSSMGCGKRDRLLTQSTTSSPVSRRNASTDGLEPPSSRNVPTANASCRRRTASMVRVLVDRQVEPARVGGGEAGVAVRGPLHRGTDTIAVTEPDVVAHADLVAV